MKAYYIKKKAFSMSPTDDKSLKKTEFSFVFPLDVTTMFQEKKIK